MAGGTVGAEHAQVILGLNVAGLAFLGRAFEDHPCIALNMTLDAGDLEVGSRKLKSSQ